MQQPTMHDVRAQGGLLRAAALAGYSGLVRDLGGSPEMLLARYGLSVELMDNPESMVPFNVGLKLLSDAAESCHCPHFGLALGQRQDPATLGVLFLMMQQCSTLKEGFEAIINHFEIHNLGADVALYEENEVAELEYGIWVADGPLLLHGQALGLTIAFKVAKLLCGADWSPIEVHLTCAKPEDTRPYLRFFGVPVYFAQPRSSLFFNARWLTRPTSSGQPFFNQIVSDFLNQRHADTQLNWSTQVRRLIRTLLPFGNANIAHVAQTCGISRRTMHRHLAAADTTFETLLEEVRFELIDQLMRRPAMSLSEIASAAGYSDLSAFSRACKRHFGQSPSARRADLLADPALSRTDI